MSSVNESISRIRELLINPKEQMPTVKAVFGACLRSTQLFYNTLGNSSQPFTTLERQIVINNSISDYLISQDSGKVLFVTATDNTLNPSFPYSVEFTDLQDASVDWWSYYPVTAARPEDYNFASFPLQIAFYRRNGQLYAKVPQYYYNNTLTVTVATGNWTSGIGAEQSAVLSEYHPLIELRAAISLLPSARWTDDRAEDKETASNLLPILAVQRDEYLEQFNIAKRGLTASDVVYIETNDWCF